MIAMTYRDGDKLASRAGTPPIDLDKTDNQQTETYEPPELTEVSTFVTVTKGQYSRTHSDDSDAGGYWNE